MAPDQIDHFYDNQLDDAGAGAPPNGGAPNGGDGLETMSTKMLQDFQQAVIDFATSTATPDTATPSNDTPVPSIELPDKLRSLPFKVKPCRYFQRSGHCKNGDACTYIHDSDSTAKAPAPDHKILHKTKTCRYWLEGHCPYEERCTYLHEHKSSKSSTPQPQPTPTSSQFNVEQAPGGGMTSQNDANFQAAFAYQYPGALQYGQGDGGGQQTRADTPQQQGMPPFYQKQASASQQLNPAAFPYTNGMSGGYESRPLTPANMPRQNSIPTFYQPTFAHPNPTAFNYGHGYGGGQPGPATFVQQQALPTQFAFQQPNGGLFGGEQTKSSTATGAPVTSALFPPGQTSSLFSGPTPPQTIPSGEQKQKGMNPRYRTKVCRFFQAGYCSKGDACTYKHE